MSFLKRDNGRITDVEISQVLKDEEVDEEAFWDEAALEFYHCWSGSWSRKKENMKERASPTLWKEVDSKAFNDYRRAAKEFLESMARRYLDI